jgi:hypothetical protein
MSKTRWGTGCFTSREAAVLYYAAQNIDKEGVAEKIRRGEIKIGFPPLKEGQRAVVIDDGKRYAIEEESE